MQQIIESFEDVIIPIAGTLAAMALLASVWVGYTNICSNILNSMFFG